MATFMTVERELVFDIDLTDYDDVRTCGSGGHICNACWPLMAVAIQVCTTALCPSGLLAHRSDAISQPGHQDHAKVRLICVRDCRSWT